MSTLVAVDYASGEVDENGYGYAELDLPLRAKQMIIDEGGVWDETGARRYLRRRFHGCYGIEFNTEGL